MTDAATTNRRRVGLRVALGVLGAAMGAVAIVRLRAMRAAEERFHRRYDARPPV